jgi:ribosomal-protein-alanine N-acetyltransferase
MAQRAGVHPGDQSSVITRPATDRDVDRVSAIERMSFSDPWSRGSFDRLVDDDRVHFAVACDAAGAVVGYVVAWFVMDEGEIADLAVAPEARKLGVGKLLLGSALRAARARGASAIYLEVRESNEPARRLYASHGFTEIGRRRRYYRKPVEDALVLRLVLPSQHHA